MSHLFCGGVVVFAFFFARTRIVARLERCVRRLRHPERPTPEEHLEMMRRTITLAHKRRDEGKNP